jgi:hypothetical protein
MLFVYIVNHYLLWHYTTAQKEILHIAKNFIWFITNFFSIPSLVRSLFSPWKRMTESKGSRFSLEDMAGYVIINLFSRLVGAIMRLSIIATGLLFLLITVALTLFTFVFWIFAPALLLVSMLYGLVLIFA